MDGSRLLDNQVVLEMKYRREMPALFKMLVEEFTLNPQSVSKYRLAAMALDLVTEPGSAARSEASTLNCIYA